MHLQLLLLCDFRVVRLDNVKLADLSKRLLLSLTSVTQVLLFLREHFVRASSLLLEGILTGRGVGTDGFRHGRRRAVPLLLNPSLVTDHALLL